MVKSAATSVIAATAVVLFDRQAIAHPHHQLAGGWSKSQRISSKCQKQFWKTPSGQCPDFSDKLCGTQFRLMSLSEEFHRDVRANLLAAGDIDSDQPTSTYVRSYQTQVVSGMNYRIVVWPTYYTTVEIQAYVSLDSVDACKGAGQLNSVRTVDSCKSCYGDYKKASSSAPQGLGVSSQNHVEDTPTTTPPPPAVKPFTTTLKVSPADADFESSTTTTGAVIGTVSVATTTSVAASQDPPTTTVAPMTLPAVIGEPSIVEPPRRMLRGGQYGHWQYVSDRCRRRYQDMPVGACPNFRDRDCGTDFLVMSFCDDYHRDVRKALIDDGAIDRDDPTSNYVHKYRTQQVHGINYQVILWPTDCTTVQITVFDSMDQFSVNGSCDDGELQDVEVLQDGCDNGNGATEHDVDGFMSLP